MEYLALYDKFLVCKELYGHCMNKFDVKNITFENEKYQISEIMLNENLFDENKGSYIPITYVRNHALNLDALKKYDELELFVNKYRHRFVPKDRTSYENYCYAVLEYSRKNYDNALSFLSKNNLSNLLIKIDSRLLMFRIYYDAGYVEAEYYLLDSFRHYLKNNNIPDQRRTNLLTITDLHSKLLKVKLSKNKESIFKLNKEIDERVLSTHNRFWFNDKLEELKLETY
jgi:hypothetical protein